MAALEARGLAALSCPLFSITASGDARPSGKFAALLVTSGQGASGLTPALADLPATLPVFAVGDRTAEAMTANGFSNVTSASGDQKALTRLVLAKLPPRYRVLLATGEDHKDGLPAAFADAGHEIALWIRYRAEPVAVMPEAALAAFAEGSIDKVLHYSRRASEVFVALSDAAGVGPSVAELRHFALSADVAEPLKAAGFTQVTVAGQADEEHMLALFEGGNIASAKAVLAASVADGVAPAMSRMAPRTRKIVPAVNPAKNDEVQMAAGEAKAALQPVIANASSAETVTIVPGHPELPEMVSPVLQKPADAVLPTEAPPASVTPAPAIIRHDFGLGATIAVALASGVIGAGLVGYIAPLLGVSLPSSPPLAEISARLAKLEAPRPPQSVPDLQAVVQSAIQSAPVAAQVRDQINGLERRIGELAARPQGGNATADNAALAEMRARLTESERAAQALAPRLEEIEKVARNVGAPSASATGAAKLIVADRLTRALAEGRPFTTEMTALTALGATAEPLRVLGPMATSGAPAMTVINAEFRKLRPVFVAEPASPDAPWSERLLKLTDGLVRVRSTGAVQGASPAAVASRIDQALQRGDVGAAATAFAELPEPARRAGEAWMATLSQRANADQAIKTITDDAIKALSAQK
ncbi:MAG: uroporphyrinogen-III synthase [Bosea sp. (in: a-proteobacteria)]